MAVPDRALQADVAVVGLGAMGAAALYQLARRGVSAIGIDRYDPPHEQGSSHGETRITRQAVGEGPAFAPLVIRSHQIWRELEAATGESLLVACGCLIMGSRQARAMYANKPDFMAKTLAVADRFAIPHEVLAGRAIAERFPQFINPAADDVALYEPGGGYLRPEACVRTQLAEARRRGARVLTDQPVLDVAQDGGGVRIGFGGGEIRAERAIVAAGAWNGTLLGEPFSRLLKVERQILFWFASDGDAYESGRCPVYIRIFGSGDQDFFYGFPTPRGARGVKVATEQHVEATDAETVSRTVSAAEAARFYQSHIAGRLLDVTGTLLQAKVCLYTTTITDGSNFVLDWHPRMDRVYVISACSGHGFKHSAAIGEAVADIVTTGKSALDLAPFGMDRLQT